MAWSIEYSDEFEAWWRDLTVEQQIQVARKVELLESHGPGLKRRTPT